MTADALIRSSQRVLTREEVAKALAGNLCRCTGYVKILDAVVEASQVICATPPKPPTSPPMITEPK